MLQNSTPVLIYTTWPDTENAAVAGDELVSQGLAACVNILAPATSIYFWQSVVQRGVEVPMLIKTVSKHVDAVTAVVKKLHPFDVPAVAVFRMEGGNPAFLDWIALQTADASSQKDAST